MPLAATDVHQQQSLEDLCGTLRSLQQRRVFCIKQQSRIDRAIEQVVARDCFGYSASLDESARKKIFKLVAKMIKDVTAGTYAGKIVVGRDIKMIIELAAEDRKGWDYRRNVIEKKMEKLASVLPAVPFISSVKGVSLLGLAVVVGTAGNLSKYPNRWKLQKWLGLGILKDGTRQRLIASAAPLGKGHRKLSQDEVLFEIGYVPQRRAECWAFFDNMMFRAQWRGEKDGVPAHAIGPYGEYYGKKRAEYIERGHAAPDKAARRYMTKMFIRDLWRAWCAVAGLIPEPPRRVRSVLPKGLALAALPMAPESQTLEGMSHADASISERASLVS